MRPAIATPLTGAAVMAVTAVAVFTAGCTAPLHRSPPGRPGGDAIGRADRGLIREGGTLRIGIGELPAQWNVWHAGGTGLDAVRILRTVLPALFRSDRSGRVTADPDYLVRARVTRVRPRQVVTYDLDPRARWSDGTPLGYRDFAALWHACAGRDPAYRAAASTGYDRIESVRGGPGGHQVVVTFARPFGEWRSLFSPLYPARMIGTPHRWDDAWLNRIPVTAGPFRPERIDLTAKTVSVVRNPAWWGRRPRLDRVVFRSLARDAMPGAFAAGDIDTFDAGPDAAAYRRAAMVPGAAIRVAAGPEFTQITFNGAAPALADARVRRAVAMAIDRRTVVRSVFAGLGLPARPLNDHVFMTTQAGYRDNAGHAGTYDPAAAARSLDAAGWRRAGPVRRKDGRALRLRYVYPASARVSERIGELVRAMLGRVGVAVALWPVPDADLFGRYLLRGDFDLAPFTWSGTPFPISAMRPVYGRPRGGDIQQNLARIGSARLDAVIDRAVGRLDEATAMREANAADRMIWAEMHSLPLYQRPQIVPTRASVAGWGAFGLADPVWTDIGFLRE